MSFPCSPSSRDQFPSICHWLAHPVSGLGVAIPVFVPPLATAAVALLLSIGGRDAPIAAPLAYISGSLGTLIGSLNLGNVQGLGAPVASIGGAGTFDGIFLTGILAVLRVSIDQLVGPLVLGRMARLHPVVIIFAFLSGAVLFGVIGLLLAVPVAASIKIVLTTYCAEPADESRARRAPP
ncbi:MAG TPA: AI-2E family transporter [Stellaceae bacterium]|nr:AI-2E family transporter [Stellaceae bacterium]